MCVYSRIPRPTSIDKSNNWDIASTKTLEGARVSATRPSTVPSAQDHADKIDNLDTQRLSLTSNFAELEDALQAKETALKSLKDESRKLEDSDLSSEHAQALDGSMYVKKFTLPLLID